MTRPCLICYREKCKGVYYEIWEGGYVHYRFVDRNSSLGKDYDRLKEQYGNKTPYTLKKIVCEMIDNKIYKNRFEAR